LKNYNFLGWPAHFIRRHPKMGSLTKAFHFVIGFLVQLGTSLEEFAEDVRAISEFK